MNANEIADELDKQETIASMTTLRKIATMLRQQQAEIEVLKSRELTDDELFHAIRRIGYTSINQTDEIVEEIRKAQEK